PIVRRRRAHRALQLDDADVTRAILRVLEQPAAGLAAFLEKVRAHEGDVQRVIAYIDRAVGEDDGDLRDLGLTQHRFPPGLDDRRERDHIHALRDERAERLDLVFLLLLRVGELELDARRLRGGLDGVRVRRAPLALGANLAEPEHDRLRGARHLTAGGRRALRATGEAREA